ncbi:MAG: SCO family protein [Ignavibacteria bacterium]|nr:SCO family protein [Ignavibacteria bacterium]MBT8392203.1 SCO family protein [Ignavibacteria bacterium]NNL20738.1 SCO family protein [Ignavibacteriaceae bacterium]
MKNLLKIFLIIIMMSSFVLSDEKIDIGIDERLGSVIPKDAMFFDEAGNEVLIGDLTSGPTVLTLVYYDCPGICNPLLFELSEVMNRSELEPGYDYNVVSISIDKYETPELASKKKKEFLSGFDKDISEDSWKFLTGNIENIKKVTESAGFYFKREGDELRHAGALIFIDGNGKICRYLFPSYSENYGYGILPFDFKMAILETSQGKEIPTIARVLRFCFSYDTEGQNYTLNFTRIFGIGILILAGIFFIIIKLKPKKEIVKAR